MNNNDNLPQKQFGPEITLLHEIKDRLLAGHSRNQIALDFNNRKIPTRHIDGEKWTAATINNIASNPIYAGISISRKKVQRYNPILESTCNIDLPPEEWEYEILPNSIYTIWSIEEFINLQKVLLASSTGKRGRREGTFGAYTLSGILYCGYCGAILEGAGGREPTFRCKNCKKHRNNQSKCTESIQINEALLTDAVIAILIEALEQIYTGCISIFNDQIKTSARELTESLSKKQGEYKNLLEKRDSIINLYSEARRQGFNSEMSQYPALAADTENKLKKLCSEIEDLKRAQELHLNPLTIDENLFLNEIHDLKSILQETTDTAKKRTAIKSIIPKILIKAKRNSQRQLSLSLIIPEIPKGLEHVLKPEYSFLTKKTSLMRQLSDKGLTDRHIYSQWLEKNGHNPENTATSFFQGLHEDLQNTYVFYKSSCSLYPPIPIRIEAILNCSARKAIKNLPHAIGCVTVPFWGNPLPQ